jgi:hypothetical protein
VNTAKAICPMTEEQRELARNCHEQVDLLNAERSNA